MKPSALSSLLIAGAVALSACGGNDKGDQSGQQDMPEPDKVVARVNGEPISSAALDAQVQAQSKQGQPASREKALDRLVDLKLLAQKAEEQGLHKNPEVAAKIARQRANILAQHLVRSRLANYEPSEEELRKAYEERTSGGSGKEYKASHILLKEESKAKDMIKQLDNGADFASLAKEHSTGPTSKRGGNLGWFDAGQMVEPFSKAVQDLDKGSHTSAPVKTRFGWHVIRLEDVREKEKPAFEDMKGKLRQQLASQHVQDYIASLRKDAEIEMKMSSEKEGNAEESGTSDKTDNDSGQSSESSDSGGSSGGAY